jgi:transposase InsO family protein
MDTMLEGIPNALAVMDDILVWGRNQEDHDKTLRQVLDKAKSWNLKFNLEKCKIAQSEVLYVGHIISHKGIRPNPEKVQAIEKMPPPQSKEDVRRFLGMVTYLQKFIPKLSEVDKPLRDLLKNDVMFTWSKECKASFQKLKELCSTSCQLTLFDPMKTCVIQCDASSFALGAVLMQDDKVITYSSQALTETQQRYSQIEKELLAVVFATKKFHHYIYGAKAIVQSDHKPLIPIMKKNLAKVPARLQSMILKLQPYDLDLIYKKGKEMYLADTLSRASLTTTDKLIEEVCVNKVIMSSEKVTQMKAATANEMSALMETIKNGWPNAREEADASVRSYWSVRDELTVEEDLVYRGTRLVVPPSLRRYVLNLAHQCHLGMNRSKLRARESFFWPGMNAELIELITNCSLWQETQKALPKQPMELRDIPERPWQHVGSDIFQYGNRHYVVAVDYFSKWIAVKKLDSLTASGLVHALCKIFYTHGFPEQLTSDNGPQYASVDFKSFCVAHAIRHTTSSPYNPMAKQNGRSRLSRNCGPRTKTSG